MRSGTPVESLAAAIYTAIADPQVLPDIEHEFRQQRQKGRPSISDIEIIHFPQTWGSTALGFGGIGGAAMTTAYTTVILCKKNAAVFFAGRHCYSVDEYGDEFVADLSKRKMKSLQQAKGKY